MKTQFKSAIKHGLTYKPSSVLRRMRLGNAPFCVIADDCYGGEVYRDFHRPFNSPFIGTLVPFPDFLKLVSDFRNLITSDLRFVESSQWPQWPDARMGPIALLGETVEIQFRHYKSVDEAQEKWTRRVKRIDYDSLVFKASGDNDSFITADYQAFDLLPVRRKVAFSRYAHGLDSVVRIPNYVTNGKKMYSITNQHFDIVDLIKK